MKEKHKKSLTVNYAVLGAVFLFEHMKIKVINTISKAVIMIGAIKLWLNKKAFP